MPNVDSKTPWQPAPSTPSLAGGAVHVWKTMLCAPDSVVDRVRELLLSDDERARADRALRPDHRRRVILARAWLRSVLARYAGMEPNALNFLYGKGGKPALEGREDLKFNLSHSADLALMAVTRAARVGIDVEQIRDGIAFDSIILRHFASAEVAALTELDKPARRDAFFRVWTRKEAIIKALGSGLATGLKTFEVSVNPDEPARVVSDTLKREGAWRLHDLDLENGFLGCVAVPGPREPSLQCYTDESVFASFGK